MFKPKTPRDGRLEKSSGAQIRTEDLRIMSKDPESVPFVRRGYCRHRVPQRMARDLLRF